MARRWFPWLERLEPRRSDDPAHVHAVQPVSIVADDRHLSTPLLWAAGSFGCRVAAVAAQRAAITAWGPHPCWVDVLVSAAAATRVLHWEANIALGDPLAWATGPTRMDVAPWVGENVVGSNPNPPSETKWHFGNTLQGAPAVDPNIHVAANTPVRLPRLFKPEGGWLWIMLADVNVEMAVSGTFYEAPGER